MKALFQQTSFAVADIIPITAPASIGYLGRKNSVAIIFGADDHSKIMNDLSDILKGVNDTDAFILGLGDAGCKSETLPDILDDSAVHPCYWVWVMHAF